MTQLPSELHTASAGRNAWFRPPSSSNREPRAAASQLSLSVGVCGKETPANSFARESAELRSTFFDLLLPAVFAFLLTAGSTGRFGADVACGVCPGNQRCQCQIMRLTKTMDAAISNNSTLRT